MTMQIEKLRGSEAVEMRNAGRCGGRASVERAFLCRTLRKFPFQRSIGWAEASGAASIRSSSLGERH